ncbi:MAG: hypothetical protein J5I98_23290 [Phaeodactylibacter sp.]|nr:hypothetical protein [Phaeodactylibacter sp.]
MKTLKNHARRMRREIFAHQLRTRGAKYRSFLRYLRLFKYAAFSPLRGTFLESYYTLMRYLDDKELMYHFHLLDIRGTIRATLKIFREDPEKYPLLGPLGLASRFYYDLRDFGADIRAGYVNISIEDARAFGIGRKSLQDANSPGVRRWFRSQATRGLEMLEEHHRRLPEGRFSLLARATFPLVYEAQARKFFDNTLKRLSLSELPAKEAKTLPLDQDY